MDEDYEYDPYEDGLASGTWTKRDGTPIKVGCMSDSHIRNTINVCERAAQRATFSCNADTMLAWIDVFQEELERRRCSKES